MKGDPQSIEREFSEAVNMSTAELEDWLATDESKEVGQVHEGERESVGHASGRRIIMLLRKKSGFSDDDYAHMRKVVGYVRRHMAQGGPERDKTHSRWRYSLMNWGHDPLKR